MHGVLVPSVPTLPILNLPTLEPDFEVFQLSIGLGGLFSGDGNNHVLIGRTQ